MKIIPKICKSIIEIPADAVLPYLGDCSGTELKVLLYVLNSPEFDEQELCENLNITKKSLDSALSFWEEKGAFEQSKAAKRTVARSAKKKGNVSVSHSALMHATSLPGYTSDEIAAILENNEKLESLIMSCQMCIGKMFNTAEIEIVVGLADYLKFDDDYILLLFSHCVSMGKKSLRYIEKLAIGLFDDGIFGYDELDAHLTAIEETFKAENSLRKLFGIGKRALTNKEKESFSLWIGKWKMPFELIEKAYEITVENTAGASVPYCSAVLEKWYAASYTTVEEVDAAIEEYRHDRDGVKDKKGSFETDDFFEAALKRSYGK